MIKVLDRNPTWNRLRRSCFKTSSQFLLVPANIHLHGNWRESGNSKQEIWARGGRRIITAINFTLYSSSRPRIFDTTVTRWYLEWGRQSSSHPQIRFLSLVLKSDFPHQNTRINSYKLLFSSPLIQVTAFCTHNPPRSIVWNQRNSASHFMHNASLAPLHFVHA